jgi:hypothetical protein
MTAYSDRRVKTDIQQITNSLQTLLRLKGVTYLRTDTNQRGRGFVAQDMKEVYPENVRDNGQDQMLSIAYDNLLADIVEAIRELYHMISGSDLSNKE